MNQQEKEVFNKVNNLVQKTLKDNSNLTNLYEILQKEKDNQKDLLDYLTIEQSIIYSHIEYINLIQRTIETNLITNDKSITVEQFNQYSSTIAKIDNFIITNIALSMKNKNNNKGETK